MSETRHVAVFLFLEKDGQFLAMRRANTGYMDGRLSLPSGHVEHDETPTLAVLREMREEIGIELRPEEVQHCHAQHYWKPGDRIYTNHYYWARLADKEPYNAEPDKCSELVWLNLDDEKPDVLRQVQLALKSIKNNVFYSEFTLREGEEG